MAVVFIPRKVGVIKIDYEDYKKMGFKGISYSGGDGKHPYATYTLFKNEDDAAMAYNSEALIIFGEYAKLNESKLNNPEVI